MLKTYKIHYSFTGRGKAFIEAKDRTEAQRIFEDRGRVILDGEREEDIKFYTTESVHEES